MSTPPDTTFTAQHLSSEQYRDPGSPLNLGAGAGSRHGSQLTPGRFSSGKYRKFFSSSTSTMPSPSPSASLSPPPHMGATTLVADDLSKLNIVEPSSETLDGEEFATESVEGVDSDSDVDGGVSLNASQPIADPTSFSTVTSNEGTAVSNANTIKKEKNHRKKEKKKQAKLTQKAIAQSTGPKRASARLAAKSTTTTTTTMHANLEATATLSQEHNFEAGQTTLVQGNQTTAPPQAQSSSKASAIQAPPVPTEAYMRSASNPVYFMDAPVSILVILDLNGTLLFRNRQKTGNVSRASANPELRPHLLPFLDFLFNNFQVMIWSSATPPNVQRMAAACFSKEQLSKLVATWARDTLGLQGADYRSKVITYKRLDQVFNKVKHPAGVMWNETNTVLIDDSAIKAQSHPFNHVEVPDFDEELVRSNDNALAEVAGYLEALRWSSSVASFIHKTPFRIGQGWVAPWLE